MRKRNYYYCNADGRVYTQHEAETHRFWPTSRFEPVGEHTSRKEAYITADAMIMAGYISGDGGLTSWEGVYYA